MLTHDSELLVQHVLPRTGEAVSDALYPVERVRTGIVVGSVQSGKTASMLALAARCLDRRVDILIILAGTRIALWLQTYERLMSQLDGTSRSTFYQGASRRVFVPNPDDLLGEERASPTTYLSTQRRSMERAIRAKLPIIMVIPKEDDHLISAGRMLQQILSTANVAQRTKPIEMVVLDDEADDASVLDSSSPEKLTPRLIQQLWATHSSAGATWRPELFANYVAYTATPQANFAQAMHNPLAPRSFRFVLRTPDQSGELEPRHLTYEEPAGIRSYYTGGRTFYERLRGRPGDFCVPYSFPVVADGEEESAFQNRFEAQRWKIVGDALRAYFVAGAIRLHESGKRISTLGSEPLTLEQLRVAVPSPHTMLYHPSALMESHFNGAKDIARWCAASPGQENQTEPPLDDAGRPIISMAGLVSRLSSEESQWRAWLQMFGTTAASLRLMPKGQFPKYEEVPWEAIATLLATEVFPATKIRIINSDPDADDRPEFGPRAVNGGYVPPSEIFSIFVAGNVLSRGLTVEGLCTSVFLRSAKEPAADTQMQMQRWFGYRGSHLALCRVFLFEDQLELYRAYHANDEALKQDILKGKIEESDVLVLQGDNFVATAKVATHQAPLHPGPSPAIRLVEHSDQNLIDHNVMVVVDELSAREYVQLTAIDGAERGLITSDAVTLIEIAALLERLRYSSHDPDPALPIYKRWTSLRARFEIDAPLLRTPHSAPGLPAVEPRGCPYSIAAYLRLWDAVLSRRNAPGLYPTDRSNLSWHLIDLAAYQATRPRFYIGIRFGEGPPALDPRLRERGVVSMTRGLAENRANMLETLWGSRRGSANYYGDQLFDYHHHRKQPLPSLHGGTVWRPRGHPGLLLFHIVRHPHKAVDMIAAGLALPHGGPDHIAALRGADSW